MKRARVLAAIAAFTFSTAAWAQWTYGSTRDQMSDKVHSFARVASTNSHKFGAPYGGRTRAYLTLWHNGGGDEDIDVLFHISNGQVLCSRGDCTVLVRFDDDEAIRFRGSPAADYSHNAVFIGSEDHFITQVQIASRTRIEALYFQQGRLIFDFNVDGLQWPPPARPPPTKKR